MDNPFDQFDPPAAAQSNPFDQFDPPAAGGVNNFGAGLNTALYRILGAPVDAAAHAIDSGYDGLLAQARQTYGDNAVQVLADKGITPWMPSAPVGGSQWIAQQLGGLSPALNPQNTVATTSNEKLARSAGDAAGLMVFPEVGAEGLAGAIGEPLTNLGIHAAASGLDTAGRGLMSMVSGAASGASEEAANQALPQDAWYTPTVKTLAGLVGGAAPLGIAAAGKVIFNTVRDAVVPYYNTIFDPSSEAAAKLVGAAGDQSSVVAAPDEQSPVPGSQWTLAQSMPGNAGIVDLERGRQTANGAPFAARRASQVDARTDAIDAMAPQGDVGAAGDLFARQADELASAKEAATAEAAQKVSAATQTATDLMQSAGTEGASRVAATQNDTNDILDSMRLEAAQKGQAAQSAADDSVTQVAQAGNASVADTQAQRQAALAGVTPSMPPVDAAGTIRDAAASNMAGEKAAVSPAFEDWKTSGVVLPTNHIKDAAEEVMANHTEDAAPLSGEEGKILNRLSDWGEGIPAQNFQQMQSRIATEIARARQAGESETAYRLGAIRDAFDKQLYGDDGGAAATPPAAAPVAGAAGGPATTGAVYTPSGRKIDTNYEVVDVPSLITSHDQNMRPNPAFPRELQPRDRERAASDLQVSKIANDLTPERLGASNSAGDGAPIIGPDDVVESGNARVLGISRAYGQGGERAQNYRAWLESQGYDTAGMKQPVLVRRRISDLSPQDRVAFTQEANAGPGLAMSATERAKVDAGRMSDGALNLYRGGDIGSADNRDFVRAFMKEVPEKGEEGGMVTPDARLSSDGLRRIQAALFHKAYGDPELLTRLAEHGDEGIRALGAAMTGAAPGWAKMRSGIAAGDIDPAMDITSAVTDAARMVQMARIKGIPLADMVAQQDAFAAHDPHAVQLLKGIYGPDLAGRVSQARVSSILNFYAEEASKQTNGARLFGENALPSEILQTAEGRYNGGRSAKNELEGAGSAGAGNGAGGDQARASGYDAGGAATAAIGGNHQGARVLPSAQESLKPNFNPSQAEGLRDAREKWRDIKGAYEGDHVIGDVLKKGGRQDYDLSLSEAADKLAGSRVRPEDVNAFIRAAGDRQDAANAYLDLWVGRLSKFIDPATGKLNEAAFQKFTRDNSDGLAAMTRISGSADMVNKFRNLASANKLAEAATVGAKEASAQAASEGKSAVGNAISRGSDMVSAAQDYGRGQVGYANADAAATAKMAKDAGGQMVDHASEKSAAMVKMADQATKDYQNSVAGLYLGHEPDEAIAKLFRKSDPGQRRAALADLATQLDGHPDALAGVRRSIADHINTTFNGSAPKSFDKWFRSNELGLRHILTPEQMDVLQAVRADSLRTDPAIGKDVAGPGTARDLNAAQRATKTIGGAVLANLGTAIGTAAGSMGGGIIGAVGGGFAGKVIDTLHAAGVTRVNDIVDRALLDPKFAAILAQKYHPRQEAQIARRLAVQMGQVGVVSATRSAAPFPVSHSRH